MTPTEHLIRWPPGPGVAPLGSWPAVTANPLVWVPALVVLLVFLALVGWLGRHANARTGHPRLQKSARKRRPPKSPKSKRRGWWRRNWWRRRRTADSESGKVIPFPTRRR